MIKSACFASKKFASNNQSLLESIPPEYRHDHTFPFDPTSRFTTKVLGIERISLQDTAYIALLPIILQSWSQYRPELNLSSSLSLAPFLPVPNAKHVSMHGFCDASETGYATVVYVQMRIQHHDGCVTTHLIMSAQYSLLESSPNKNNLCTSIGTLRDCILTDLVECVRNLDEICRWLV